MEGELKEVREAYESGKTRSLSWRLSQLKALLRLLYDKEDDIFKALEQDLGKHRAEAYRDEVGLLIKSVNYAIGNLRKWMTPNKVSVPLVAFPSRADIVPEPLGVVLIFSSWNFPIGLSLEPLIGAISAGNAIIIKPSELAPESAEFLARSVSKYLDDKLVKVITGGPDAGQKLLDHKWDKIFFTGSPRVGRIVMAAAAKHLTPVSLELGGKCPAIIDSLTNARDRKIAVRRIIGGKWVACSGQACIGVDYILVEEKFAPILIDMLKATIEKFYPAFDTLSKIINKHHFQRLASLIKDPSVADTIVHGGSMDSDKLFIEPTILLDPPLDAEIMTEEIFGPLLPVITVKKIEDSIDFIRTRPKPLAIYAFTQDEKLKNRLVSETSSGSLTFNDTMLQFAIDTLPFGGVGASGFGQYHGKFSFDMFSHKKSVMRRSFLLEYSFRYPPWDGWKLPFMRSVFHFDYVSLLLRLLGLKR
ncbi:aldehyde dehydrogenase family 3 member F1-like isoform X1 [Zingiber officinale]|uniref:Aldehyde dehydrogenase n=1 Tax=Zingiber officinale TaxID=94328 RepID=A0A8J5HEB1_ZINOF|nr:aldehyde dehydrogenase family 3 member F1-like isoform X1 [Zingiber officinale]KAG6519397.1 hypothetical protein ZIOFF_022890 [Zingiber officinale]